MLNLLNLEEELYVSDTGDTRLIHLIITRRFCCFFSSCLSAFIWHNLTFRHKHLLFCPIICTNFSLIQTAILSSVRMTPAGLAPTVDWQNYGCHSRSQSQNPGLGSTRMANPPPGELLGHAMFHARNTVCGSATWVSAQLCLLHPAFSRPTGQIRFSKCSVKLSSLAAVSSMNPS